MKTTSKKIKKEDNLKKNEDNLKKLKNEGDLKKIKIKTTSKNQK